MELCSHASEFPKIVLSPFISICIPSYNRPESLLYLLDNIQKQDLTDFEVVICEDHSPRRVEIRTIAEKFQKAALFDVRYYENETNLGYDKNLKELIHKASGEYIIFMGDDDAFVDGGLAAFMKFLKSNDQLGYVLKTHMFIHKDGKQELFKYFDSDTFFEAGEMSVHTLFRKSVLISGFCIKRNFCLPHLIDNFDGTLLFQLYLLAEVCLSHPSAFCSIPLTVQTELLRQTPMFGSSEAEKDLYKPGTITPLNSINFMKGFFRITNYIDEKYKLNVTKAIRKDFSKYSYPVLSIQREKGLNIFIKYIKDLIKTIQIHRSVYFYIYSLALIIFGVKICNGVIMLIKKVLGKTPRL